MLIVQSVDFYTSKNGKLHRTDSYHLVRRGGIPVLRRGYKFYLAIVFDRPFKPESYDVTLIFSLGPLPTSTKGTQVVLGGKSTNSDTNKEWWSNVISITGNTAVFEVQISVGAPVGSWSFTVYTNQTNSLPTYHEYRYQNNVYILFNPWCAEDGVFMDDEEKREEYVLNDVGKIWKGTYKFPEGSHWVYGQFHYNVLPVIMVLLERSDLPHADRWDPVKMSRTIAALVNAEDDYGLLQGEWISYSGGVSPYAWTGTVQIIENFIKNGYNTVKYAQCWVFAGAVTTICRALGIPCRTITNFQSAHDTNRSLTVDIYSDSNGERLENLNADSCWNFHCWTDVYMSRPDLPSGYGGWQIIDATPQEPSDGKYRCGPVSVAAVRRGDVNLLYDTLFAYTEVNGDLCYFQQDNQKRDFTLISINEEFVGQQIVTKKRGPIVDFGMNNNNDMEDITELYKYLNKNEERNALWNAIRSVPLAQQIYQFPLEPQKDVLFKLSRINYLNLGESFSVVVNAKNMSNENRTISAIVSTSSILYTGVTIHKIKKSRIEIMLLPNREESFSMKVNAAEYLTKLVGDGMLKRYVLANVKETKQVWVEDDSFSIVKPALTITTPLNDVLKTGTPVSSTDISSPTVYPGPPPAVYGSASKDFNTEATFSFHNPLPITLTDCYFSIQIIGVDEFHDIQKFRDVNPDEHVQYVYSFSSLRSTSVTVLCSFASNQLNGVVGYKKIDAAAGSGNTG